VNDTLRRLNLFEKRNPPCFKGGYNLEGAQTWLCKLEKIFHDLQCDKADKVTFAAYALLMCVKQHHILLLFCMHFMFNLVSLLSFISLFSFSSGNAVLLVVLYRIKLNWRKKMLKREKNC